MNEVALGRRLSDVVAEYESKSSNIDAVIAAFEDAGRKLQQESCVSGTYGQVRIDTGRVHPNDIKASLLKSSWLHIYDKLQIDRIASAADKRRFQQAIEKPAPFTIDNIRGTFGDYILDPRGNILRGLAEVFCSLDHAYKSHDKMRIGATGLPKRVIISGFAGYSSWGEGKIRDILNALAAYQGKALVAHSEIKALIKNEEALLKPWSESHYSKKDEVINYPARGVRLRRFGNGNGHLFFEPDTLRDINMALAEYYGEVLPDCPEERPEKRIESTAIAKDLQYYPTPMNVVKRVLDEVYIEEGDRVLEPSCGCGRFMDALAEKGVDVFGIEVDYGRAEIARKKGHKVMVTNFLETVPTGDYDKVFMNPPFYGQHYAKHVNHALKFLKPGGTLVAVLPVTARYDHGLLDGKWCDLPVGSFRESGTNINTTIFMSQK